MSGTANDFAIMSFSTDTFPEHERVSQWRDFYGPLIAGLDVTPLSDEPMSATATAYALPGLTIASLKSSPVRLARNHGHLRQGDDRICLAIAVTGGGWLSHLGHELIRTPGSGYLCSHADTMESVSGEGISHFINVSIPRQVLATAVPQFERHFMRPISPDTEALRLLTGYVRLLQQNQLPADPALRRLVVTHVHDLVAVALGASRDAAEMANGRGLRAARLYAIKSDIRAALDSHNLNLIAVAARHGVSPRYVQALFDRDGTTFSQFLVGERLARAHRLLCDPLQTSMRISSIAYAAGFGDLSYFNRAFRRRYGATPSDVRASARPQRD